MLFIKNKIRGILISAREEITLMLVPYSHKKIKRIKLLKYQLHLFLFGIFTFSIVSLLFIASTAISENEVTYLSKRALTMKNDINKLEVEIAKFSSNSEYENNLKDVFIASGYLKKDEQILAIGGTETDIENVENYGKKYVSRELPKDMKTLEEKLNEIKISSEYMKGIYDNFTNKQEFLSAIPTAYPLGAKVGIIIRRFDVKNNSILIASPVSTPVVATGRGEISSIKFDKENNSYEVEITHRYGFKTIYSGLYGVRKLDAQATNENKDGEVIIVNKDGEVIIVNKGDTIGYIKNTGLSKKYFEYKIMIANTYIDPEYYIPNSF